MTTEQALQLITSVTESVQANRQVHIQILQAIEVIKKALEKKDENKN